MGVGALKENKINPLCVTYRLASRLSGASMLFAAGVFAPAAIAEPEVAPELPAIEQQIQEVNANASADASIEAMGIKFGKNGANSSQVVVDLSDKAAFELSRTAPSEYVLTVPGASLSDDDSLQSPIIAPKGSSGIRSARAVKTPDGLAIRMFVDPSIDLQAYPRGNEILVEALPSNIAKDPASRAQLAESSSSSAPSEAAANTGEGAGIDLGDDSSARLNPTGIVSNDGSRIYTGRLISLDLQDTDIDNALRIIAEVSNLNIIASDEVSGKVTLRLIDVPWDQALDVILKTNGLDQVAEGNVIRIAPVDKLRQEREALKESKKAAEALEDLRVDYIRISYARVGDLVEQVQSVLSERGTVTEDERTNQLIIRDIKKGHIAAVELIKKLDLRTPQVLLETQIVEGGRNLIRNLGFQWNTSFVRSAETGNATGLNFPNSINTELGNGINPTTGLVNTFLTSTFGSADGTRALTTRLAALESEGKVRIVSKPQVATVNNKAAEIKSVETIRVKLPNAGTSVATGSGASASAGGVAAFQEIEVGIELKVTPQASPDDYVLLDVDAKSSSFGSTTVDEIPSTLERTVTSTILVKSGQTFALGGVYRLRDRDSITGLPWLKDIPVLGIAFRTSVVDKSDEELIFFITPHIVEGSFDPSLM